MKTQVLLTIAIIIGHFILNSASRKLIDRIGHRKMVPLSRTIYIEKIFTIALTLAAAILISIIWSLDYKGLGVLASSVFAVVGVALFAQWSILSNVTSSVILFFNFPARIGDRIRIVDGDDTIEGEIREINLFQVLLKCADNNTVSYPNNLLLQKPVIKLQDERRSTDEEQ